MLTVINKKKNVTFFKYFFFVAYIKRNIASMFLQCPSQTVLENNCAIGKKKKKVSVVVTLLRLNAKVFVGTL